MTDLLGHFRVEACELVDELARAAQAMQRGEDAAGALARMRRHAHTLKGTARVVRQTEIAALANEIENALQAPPDELPGPEAISLALRHADEIGARLGEAGAGPGSRAALSPVGADATAIDTVRVEVRRLDELGEAIAETCVQLAAARAATAPLRDAWALAGALVERIAREEADPARGGVPRARAIAEDLRDKLDELVRTAGVRLDGAEREIRGARDAAERLRLVAVGAIFPALERAVRDTARDHDVGVELVTRGGSVRLDAEVLAAVRDALAHVVRNAVVHGIEPVDLRRRAGKPATGRIELEARRRGHRVVITCRDDGSGIDLDEVRRSAVSIGLVGGAAAAAMGRQELLALLLRPGITTRGQVSETAGRGIGLDVLRDAVARLRGELEIRTEVGRFTEIEVRLPVSLLSVEMLLLGIGAETIAVPLEAVRRTMRIDALTGVIETPEGPRALVDGVTVPFAHLASLVPGPGAGGTGDAFSAVLIEVEGTSVAIGVDRLLGTSVEVVRAIPAVAAADAIVAGASFDGAGRPQLVLDPAGVVRAVACAGASHLPARAAAARQRPAVLVVDDSATTRMLQQSILESAGYEVDLASSAEEALAKARSRRYALFLVDVELPGMDGFAFVDAVRTDPDLHTVPTVLVTSRGSAADVRRGAEVGARGYVLKSEFEQGRYLRAIEELVA